MSNGSYLDNKPLEREALEILSNIKDEFINTIPEKIFVSRYLPMLANKTGDVDLREWISIAGHVFNKVNVVDDAGNFLFYVPAILKRPGTKEHKYAQQSVQEIVELSKLHSKNNPRMGDRILTDGLQTTVSLEKTEINKTDDDVWNAILARYNFNPDVVTSNVSDVLIKKSEAVSDDDDGYEIA
jgi:hypothetical protein